MANTIGTAYIQIEPTTQGISGSISKALDGEASSAGASAGGKLSSALGSAMKIGVAAVSGATAAVTAFGASAVSAGQTFDASMSQVGATMGFTVEEINTAGTEASATMEKLSAFAQEMGSTTAFSASEAADALNYMALAGYDADTSMQMLPNVLNLAAAGGIDLASASDMVTDAQSALGLSLDETSTMVDQMAAASSKSNTSVAQLGEAFLTIGANAKSLSGGTTELSTALGILADNGIKGAEGGTHLRNILLSLNPSTEAAANAWKGLGVNAYDADGNLRPLEDTFGDLSAAMEGMSDQEKTNLLSSMFNKTDLASINALLATSSQRWDELSGAIDGSKGAASDMAEVQLDNLQGDITLFKSALEGAQIAVSDQLTPSLREFVQFGSNGLSQLTQAFNTGGISGAMSTLGQLISDALLKVISALPQAISAGTKLLESLAQGVIQALPLLVDTALSLIQEFVTYLGENASSILTVGLTLISELATSISQALPTLLPTAMEALMSFVLGLIDNIDLLIDAAIQLTTALALGIVEALPVIMEKAPEIILKIVNALVAAAPKLITAALTIIKTLGEGLIKNLPILISKIPELIKGLIEGFKKYVESIKTIGKDIVTGIWEGISTAWQDLTANLSELAGSLVTKVKDFFKIGSPSKLMRDEVGKWIPEGMAVGIDANADSALNSIDKLAGRMNSTLQTDLANTSLNYKGASISSSDDAVLGLLARYLPDMAGRDVNVVIEGDTSKIFNVVKKQSNIYKRSTGRGAFA